MSETCDSRGLSAGPSGLGPGDRDGVSWSLGLRLAEVIGAANLRNMVLIVFTSPAGCLSSFPSYFICQVPTVSVTSLSFADKATSDEPSAHSH